MEITCSQMDVLMSFYLEDDLSETLRKGVEQHLKTCPTCKAKFNILSSVVKELNTVCKKEDSTLAKTYPIKQYSLFRNNLSAYVDNELPAEESIKMKKFTINNKLARKELEEAFNIRRLMSNSFKKTKSESKSDYSKKILKQLNLEDKNQLAFNPIILVSSAFIMSVLLISAIVIGILSM